MGRAGPLHVLRGGSFLPPRLLGTLRPSSFKTTFFGFRIHLTQDGLLLILNSIC